MPEESIASRLRSRKGLLVFLLASVWIAVGWPALGAAEGEVPPNLQVAILLKVLVYDRTMPNRAKDGLKLGVVFEPGSENSRATKDAFVKAFNDSARAIGTSPLELVEVPQGAFDAEVKKGIKIAYLCPGVNVSRALDVIKKNGLISFAPDEAAVNQGVVLGLVPREGKPRLLINVNASLSAGMQLDPQILRLAELVRGEGPK